MRATPASSRSPATWTRRRGRRLRARPDPRRWPGGAAARRDAPLACGCIGQETTGAGGLREGDAHRPGRARDRRARRALAAPGAWIVDFTNPVGIVTRALLDAGHRAVGLCNVAIGSSGSSRALLGVEPARVVVDQVGLNHLTWVRAVRLDGADVLPALLAEHGDVIAEEVELPRRLLDELGAIPSYYLRYFYAHDAVLAEQRDGVPRAHAVAEIERSCWSSTATRAEREAGAARAARRRVLQRGRARAGRVARQRRRRGARGRHAQRRDARRPRRRRRGRGARARRSDGPVPLPQAPLAPELLGLVQHVAAYERLTARGGGHARPGRRPQGAARAPADRPDELVDELLERLLGLEVVAVSVVLAVDGGNSKTDLALVSGDGEVLASRAGR